MSDSFERAMRDLHRILLDCASWKLPSAAWREIDELTEQVAQFVRTEQPAQLRKAIGTLLSMSPDRASKRITGAEHVPPRIRERINILIESIEVRTAAQPETSPEEPAKEATRHGG